MDPVRMDGAVISKYSWLADAFNNSDSTEASNAHVNESLITLELREAKWLYCVSQRLIHEAEFLQQ